MTEAPAAVGLKMHGANNTFVLVDERPRAVDDYAALARAVCAPEGTFGGADGLLVVGDARGDAAALAEMRIFNADGSEPEMCGNGVRCVARYLADRGAPDTFTIATLAGPIATEIVARAPFEARIDVGPVSFANDGIEESLHALGRTWNFVAVSLGNPHAVIFTRDPYAIDLEALGHAFQRDPRFPYGVNVHVARIVVGEAATLDVRHFERGVGLTQACGTGAVACAAVAIAAHDLSSPVTVHVPGGTLRVAWQPGMSAQLTGPAEPLFARPLPR